MVGELGHQAVVVELFNYSAYGQDTLSGRDVTNHWRTVANPAMRELLMIASKKPQPGGIPARTDDWRTVLAEVEGYWRARLPAGVTVEDGSGLVSTESLLVELQAAVATRDRMLADQEAERTEAVSRRDAEISALNERLGALQRAFDLTPSERLKRAWRRTRGRAR